MLDSTVVCRRALGCEWGGINKDGTRLAQQESTGGGGGGLPTNKHSDTYNTRVQSKVRSLAARRVCSKRAEVVGGFKRNASTDGTHPRGALRSGALAGARACRAC